MSQNEILHTVLVSLQVFTLAMNMGALIFMIIRKQQTQQRLLMFMAFSTLMYNFANLGELMPFANFELIYYMKCIETAAVATFQLAFIIFCFMYAGLSLSVWVVRGVAFIYSIITVSQFFDTGKGYYYKRMELVDTPYFTHVNFQLGFFGWCFWIFMIFIPFALEAGLIIRGVYKADSRKNKREGIVFLAQLLLILATFFLCLPIIYKYGFNPMMTVAGIALCTKIFLGWRNKGLDIISIAAKATIDSLSHAVIVIDQEGKILYCNDQTTEIVEVSNNYVGHNIKEFIQFAIDKGYAVGPHEFLKDGMMYHSQWNPIMDESGSNVGQSIEFINVTAERMAVEEMKREKIKADEENAAKSIFLANMSHEIRTPMNAIIGMSELIIEESRGRKVYDMAVQIKKASKNLLSIINNILDYSKMQSQKLEMVEDNYSLRELIEDTYNLIKIPANEKGLKLNLNLDENLPDELYGDSGKISQIIINLVNNAIKFTKKGQVDLTVNGTKKGEKVELYISVADTGMGIKEEDQKVIFESFAQVDKINNKSVEGTGLGLAITKGLVGMLGGKISLASVYGEGTTFTFTAIQQIVGDMTVRESRANSDDGKKVRTQFISPKTRILVCDDNKINIIVIKGMLENYDVKLDACNSGREAIALVEHNDYDIIMMDHMMPEMDGIETTKKIRVRCINKSKKPYIIALTANSFVGAKEMYVSNGFDNFMSKPIDKLLLYDMLSEIIPDNKKVFSSDEVKQAAYTEDELAELFMSGVDVRYALDSKGGKIDAYIKLIDLFRLESATKQREIKKAYETKDILNYEILVHGLKSTSLAIGAKNLSEMAKNHENAANEKDISFIDENYAPLLAEYDRIVHEIEKLLIKKKVIVEENEEKLDALDAASLKGYLEEILELSEAFKAKEAASKLDELLKYKLEPKVSETLEEVKLQFKMYNDDGAEDLLNDLLASLDTEQEG